MEYHQVEYFQVNIAKWMPPSGWLESALRTAISRF